MRNTRRHEDSGTRKSGAGDAGATSVEYLVVVVVIALGLVGAWQLFGGFADLKVRDSSNRITVLAPQLGDSGGEPGPE